MAFSDWLLLFCDVEWRNVAARHFFSIREIEFRIEKKYQLSIDFVGKKFSLI